MNVIKKISAPIKLIGEGDIWYGNFFVSDIEGVMHRFIYTAEKENEQGLERFVVLDLHAEDELELFNICADYEIDYDGTQILYDKSMSFLNARVCRFLSKLEELYDLGDQK